MWRQLPLGCSRGSSAGMPALLCQGERRNEETTEGHCLTQFTPPESAHHQRSWLLEEVKPTAKKDRCKCDQRGPGHQATRAGCRQGSGHDQLSECEVPSTRELALETLDACCVNSELYVVDLVAGEDQICHPEHPGCGAKLARNHVVRRRAPRRQADRPDDFREHARAASQLLEQSLAHECGSGCGANRPQQRILPRPQQCAESQRCDRSQARNY